jgi:hypothetical protein
MLFHLTVVIVAPGCLIAGWWQYHVALAGNDLSWAYTVEWPLFAVVAVVAWWNLVREEPAARDARAEKARRDEAIRTEFERGLESLAKGTPDLATADHERDETVGDDQVQDYAARVAAAARRELASHRRRLAREEAESAWARANTGP